MIFVPEGMTLPTCAAWLQVTAEVHFTVVAHRWEPREELVALLGLRKSLGARDAPWAVACCF